MLNGKDIIGSEVHQLTDDISLCWIYQFHALNIFEPMTMRPAAGRFF
jgi:hypothetical protein